jgi:integrase
MANVRSHNEGSLFLRSRDRRWVASVTMSDGRRRSRSAASKAEGAAALKELLRQRDQSVAVDPRSLRVGPFLERWLDDVRPRLAPATWRKHESIIRVHISPRIGHVRLSELSVADCRHLLAGLAGHLDAQSARHVRATLRRSLADAVRDGLVQRNVAALAEPPPMRRKRVQVLDPAQVRILIDGTRGTRLHAYWTLAATGGMRQAEMLGLTWADIDGATVHVHRTLLWEDGQPVLGRTKTETSVRDVPIPPVTVTALREHRRMQLEERLASGAPTEDGLVFVTVTGLPVRGSNLMPPFRAALASLGLPPVTIHSLRHSAASALIASGYPIAKVAAILGHSSSRVTELVYSHLTGADVKDAADVMERLYGEAL